MTTRDDWAPTYSGGWDNEPTQDTPVDAAVLNNYDTGIATAAPINTSHDSTTVILERTLAGDAFPWLTVYSDKTVKILDGAIDPSTVTGDGAALIVRGQSGSSSMQVQASTGTGAIYAICEWADSTGALIMWLANAGGLKLNDNLQLTRSVFGPVNFFADIYGYIGQHGSMTRRWAGPPGNMLDSPTATGEVFQGSRAASVGTWTGVGGASAVSAIVNPYGGVVNPGEAFNVIKLTQASGTTAGVTTGITTSNFIPCVPGNYVKAFASLRAAASTRTWTATIQFYNSSGTYISGQDIAGSGVSVTSAAWGQPVTGGVAPATAAGCALKLSAPGLSSGEIDYLTAAWISVDTRTSGAADSNPSAVWNPPFTGQNNGTGYKFMCNGDEHNRIDDNATSGHRIYRVDAGSGYWLPSQVGAPGSTAQPRWVAVA